MSHSVRVKNSKVLIPAKNIQPLLGRILKNNRAVGETSRIKHFNSLAPNVKLVELVKNTWGFVFKFNGKDNGNIESLEYIWEKKIGDEFDFMKIIAPFVEKNCYVIMFSESGDMWRYYFDGIYCKLQLPDIKWVNLERGGK